jgi:urea carboxylase-associated protein 2
VCWAETVEGGGYASRRLPRGAVVRLEDIDGDACVQLMVHNAVQPAERINVADTVKVQWQAYLGAGALLLSDMGRVLMTIVEDTSERHDCLCGCSNRRTGRARFGDGGASGPHPNGRDLLALGAAKFGLSRADVAPSINMLKSVRVDAAGALSLDGAVRPGTYVDLRAEMDVLVTIANTPHPLDDRRAYTVTPVRCLAWIGPATEAGGGSLGSATPERLRAFQNTDEYLLGMRA